MVEKDLRYVKNIINFGEKALKTYSRVNNDVEYLEDDYDLYNSVLMSLVQLGENANLLSDKFKEEHSEVNWRKHIKNRNFYVHVYGAVNNRRLAEYLQKDIPQLIEYLYGLKM
ncbi:HepT-like ribonuclease domain-containing protein [Lactococcus ileimucosae]|uniref:HepT-like ribonuclease domain-containing protein n=1 Tax=Lactococcus ileimucosae TaxID=2941329 RepID=UPI0035150A16